MDRRTVRDALLLPRDHPKRFLAGAAFYMIPFLDDIVRLVPDGYTLRYATRTSAGERALQEWGGYLDLFVLGIKESVIGLVYAVPVVAGAYLLGIDLVALFTDPVSTLDLYSEGFSGLLTLLDIRHGLILAGFVLTTYIARTGAVHMVHEGRFRAAFTWDVFTVLRERAWLKAYVVQQVFSWILLTPWILLVWYTFGVISQYGGVDALFQQAPGVAFRVTVIGFLGAYVVGGLLTMWTRCVRYSLLGQAYGTITGTIDFGDAHEGSYQYR